MLRIFSGFVAVMTVFLWPARMNSTAAGVLQRRQIPGILIEVRRSNDAAHHLVVSCPRERRHEMDGFRPQRLAECSATTPSQFLRQFGDGDVRRQHGEGDHALALHLVRYADDGGFGDGVVADEDGFDFGGADALAGDLQGVVAAAEDVPVAVLVAHRPVAVGPDVLAARPVGFEYRSRSLRNPRAMPIQGLRMTSSPTAPVGTGLAGLVDDIGVDSGTRRRERARLDRQQRIAHQDAAGDLGPAGVVDDRHAAAGRRFRTATTTGRDSTARRSRRRCGAS